METQSCTCGVHVCKRFPYDHCALSKLATRAEADAAAAAWNAATSCPDCGLVDAYGFHNAGCPQIKEA